MLKYRLLVGIPMALSFIGVLLWDGRLDGSWTLNPGDDSVMQGSLFFLLICLCQIPAHLELAQLARAKGLQWPIWVSIVGSISLCTTTYLTPLIRESNAPLMGLALVISFFTLLLSHYRRQGLDGVLPACAAGSFSLIYLGVLGAFALGVRVEFGLWALLMFVTTVKFSDVGAYTFGRLFGKHKLAPRLSPGKTWEGLAGAAGVAALVALCFSLASGIMAWPLSLVFGVAMAVFGQYGDLAESMLKRDAQVKDSSSAIPGFGGVLDILDSPLATAPVAFLFFTLT